MEAAGPGDPLPGGVEAFATARASEVVYWLSASTRPRAGRRPAGRGGGGVRMCPRSWLPASKTLDQLAASLRPLLDLRVARVLVSHGKPVLRGGHAALSVRARLTRPASPGTLDLGGPPKEGATRRGNHGSPTSGAERGVDELVGAHGVLARLRLAQRRVVDPRPRRPR